MGKSLRSKKCLKNRTVKRTEGVFGKVAAEREARLSAKLLDSAKTHLEASETDSLAAVAAATSALLEPVVVVDMEVDAAPKSTTRSKEEKRKLREKAAKNKRRRHRN